jgi:hypothetical protein
MISDQESLCVAHFDVRRSEGGVFSNCVTTDQDVESRLSGTDSRSVELFGSSMVGIDRTDHARFKSGSDVLIVTEPIVGAGAPTREIRPNPSPTTG